MHQRSRRERKTTGRLLGDVLLLSFSLESLADDFHSISDNSPVSDNY